MLRRTLFIIAGLLLVPAASGYSPEPVSGIPQRIISTAPSITEMVFALDAGSRLVGRTSFCDYPPEAESVPVIGDFASPNVETVLRLRPDLLVVYSDRGDLIRKFRPFGIRVLVLEHESLEEILESILELGAEIGRSDSAEELADRLEQQIGELAARSSEGPLPRVLFLVSRNPGALTEMYVAGGTSYIDRLLELAGGANAFGDLKTAYPKVSIEQVLVRNPDWIIDMSHGGEVSERDVGRIVTLWNNFGTLQAVKTGRIHVARTDIFIRPGPRVVEAVERLRRIIHDTL